MLGDSAGRVFDDLGPRGGNGWPPALVSQWMGEAAREGKRSTPTLKYTTSVL